MIFFPDLAAYSTSAFGSFLEFNRALGFQMKEAKSKPPAATQELPGLQWSLTPESLTVAPGEKRLRKISLAISQHLSSGTISPDGAGTLAGRLNFICSWVFSSVGKALLRPLCARQHRVGRGSDAPSEPLCVLYADAYITLAEGARTAHRWIRSRPTRLHQWVGRGAATPRWLRLCLQRGGPDLSPCSGRQHSGVHLLA